MHKDIMRFEMFWLPNLREEVLYAQAANTLSRMLVAIEGQLRNV